MQIFKYISDNNFQELTKNIFVKNLIKFSKVKDFNDPFELKPHFTGIINDELMKNFKSQNINTNGLFENIINGKEILNLVLNEFDRGINENFGILSLTTKNDNLLMWSHYANSHKGFVIEFDSNNDFFNTQIDIKFHYGKLHKVEYSEKRPTGKLADFEDITSVCLIKSIEWEYENEYRMFMPLKKADFSANDLFLFKFPSEMIKSVYLGCNMSMKNRNILINLLKSEQYLNHIKIFQSQISEDDYKLVFNEINS